MQRHLKILLFAAVLAPNAAAVSEPSDTVRAEVLLEASTRAWGDCLRADAVRRARLGPRAQAGAEPACSAQEQAVREAWALQQHGDAEGEPAHRYVDAQRRRLQPELDALHRRNNYE